MTAVEMTGTATREMIATTVSVTETASGIAIVTAARSLDRVTVVARGPLG